MQNQATNDRLTQVNKQHTELLTEIRALNIQIKKLHTIFVKRTVLWWVLGAETAIVVAVLGVLGWLTVANHSNTDRLVSRFEDSCRVRNAQIAGTKHFITDTQELQQEGEAINARLIAQLGLRLSPEDQKKAQSIQKRYREILDRYQKSQPKPLRCDIQGLAEP